jgi:hypothetical protein
MKTVLYLLLSSLILTACGGGGSSSNSTSPTNQAVMKPSIGPQLRPCEAPEAPCPVASQPSTD